VTEPKPARPPQVTLAGWLVMAGSVVVVLMAFDQVADLRSLETREAVEEYLSTPPGDSLGLGVQGVLSLLRIASMVAAASAAATAILGWQVLQRSRGARVALTLLAAPLFVTGLVSGGIASAVVTAAIVMLWFQPSRDWYDGITREAPAPPPPMPPPPTGTPPGPPTGRDPLLDLPPPSAPPLYPTAYGGGPAPAVAQRPRTVIWACLVAWLSTITVFAAFGLYALQLAVAPGEFVDDVRRAYPETTMSDGELKLAFGAFCGVAMLWSALAAGLAVLVWRRVGWASVALTVSAVLACVTLLPLVACLATVVLLHRPESLVWLRR
jgi:hypothetical protein